MTHATLSAHSVSARRAYAAGVGAGLLALLALGACELAPPDDGPSAERDAGVSTDPAPRDDAGSPPPSADAGPPMSMADAGSAPAPDAGLPSPCDAPSTGPTCGDGCAFADGNSACPRPVTGSQERCDDGNTVDGDGCSAECLVEDGWSCTVAGIPGRCWEEPTYGDLRPSSATIVEDRPGLRAASYHEVRLEVAEPLRITIEVDAVGLGDCPTDVLDTATGSYAELIRVGTSADTYVSLDASGSATLQPGAHRLVVRAGSGRVGHYTVRIHFGPA